MSKVQPTAALWIKFNCAMLIIFSAIVPHACLAQGREGNSSTHFTNIPSSNATYAEVNSQVGCDSRFIEEKKSDLFNSKFKDHWMTWEGKVIYAESSSISLDMNEKGIHELQATFSDPNSGYDILIDSTVKVRFILRGSGGCILPFFGDSARIVK